MRVELSFTSKIEDFLLEMTADADADCLALFGPSGAGKSLCLRSIAGLHTPLRGHIRIDGRSLFESTKDTNETPQSRAIGFVPQGGALFPHLSVLENLLFSGTPEHDQIDHLASRFGIQHLLQRNAQTLSGGETQRVALARALAIQPRLLLLDEPFAGLDQAGKQQLISDLKEILKSENIPAIIVTHALADVLELADAIVLLQAGVVLETGKLPEIIERAQSTDAARLLGEINRTSGLSLGRDAQQDYLFRPQHLRPLRPSESPLEHELLLECTLTHIHRSPDAQVLHLDLPSGEKIRAYIPIWWWAQHAPTDHNIRLAIHKDLVNPAKDLER